MVFSPTFNNCGPFFYWKIMFWLARPHNVVHGISRENNFHLKPPHPSHSTSWHFVPFSLPGLVGFSSRISSLLFIEQVTLGFKRATHTDFSLQRCDSRINIQVPSAARVQHRFSTEGIHSICYCHPDNLYLNQGLNWDIINVNCALGL